jgi:hypothetical protein
VTHLTDKFVRTECQAKFFVVRREIGRGVKNEKQIFKLGPPPHFTTQAVAIHVWHQNVADNDIERFALQGRKGLYSVLDFRRRVILGLQEFAQELTGRRAVINDQDIFQYYGCPWLLVRWKRHRVVGGPMKNNRLQNIWYLL